MDKIFRITLSMNKILKFVNGIKRYVKEIYQKSDL